MAPLDGVARGRRALGRPLACVPVLQPPGTSTPRPTGLPARTLAEVAAHLGVELRRPSDHGRGAGSGDGHGAGSPSRQAEAGERAITGVTLDSRDVRPGDLYVALSGARAHGADFAAAAVAAGAVACVTDEAGAERVAAVGLPAYVVGLPREVLGRLAAWVYDEPAAAMTMLGVTGTNGKTTTAYLLEAGLQHAGRTTGLVGTIETRVAGEVLPSERTTPEATDLQALLAVMRERSVDTVAMEVSSHALALGRVDGTTYDVALFTNLSEDHLDFHADLQDYWATKARLFTPERSRRGVVDVDGEHGQRLAGHATVPVWTLSTNGGPADWQTHDAVLTPTGSTFTLTGPEGLSLTCSTQLAGDFNLANAALAVVGLVAAGVEPVVAAAGVAACPGVPGRMERVAAQGVLALVDFAHTPDALRRLLATVRPLVAEGGRLLVVIGCGGDRDPHKRPVMGAIAVRDADVAVLTSDNPRSEDPAAIVAAMRVGADDAVADGAGGHLEVDTDRRAAIGLACALAQDGDVVLIAGKGHETGQEIAGVVHPFDDRLVLAEALRSVAR